MDGTEELLRTLLEGDSDGGSTGAGSGHRRRERSFWTPTRWAASPGSAMPGTVEGTAILTPNPHEAKILLGREVDQLESTWLPSRGSTRRW